MGKNGYANPSPAEPQRLSPERHEQRTICIQTCKAKLGINCFLLIINELHPKNLREFCMQMLSLSGLTPTGHQDPAGDFVPKGQEDLARGFNPGNNGPIEPP
jgi:hypothetical protein